MEKILLLGDNTIEQFPIELLENGTNSIINAGIKNIGITLYHNDVLPQLQKKVQEIDYIIIQIGITDLISANKEKQINADELIQRFKRMLLDVYHFRASLIILPIFPTQDEKLNQTIKEFNEKLAQECFESEIEFLEIYDLLLDKNDLLKTTYTEDGFNLSYAGYCLVANQITELIKLLNNNNYCM